MIANYSSINGAERATSVANGNISNCCRRANVYHTAGGFGWRYAVEHEHDGTSESTRDEEESESNTAVMPRRRGPTPKAVEQLDVETGSVIATYISINEAKRATGFAGSSISRCCRRLFRSAGGFRWRYADAHRDNELVMHDNIQRSPTAATKNSSSDTYRSKTVRFGSRSRKVLGERIVDPVNLSSVSTPSTSMKPRSQASTGRSSDRINTMLRNNIRTSSTVKSVNVKSKMVDQLNIDTYW